jgi:proline iminopeptidase
MIRFSIGLLACLTMACSPSPVPPAPPAPQGEVVWTASGEGRPIVVLHGGPGMRHDYLRPEWMPLSADARVVFYDQRGCGRSTRWGPYTWQRQLDDLTTVLGQAAPRERVVLAGTSWGAWLALAYAARHPDRVAGVVVSGVTPWPRPGDSTYAGLPPPQRARIDSLLAGLPVVPRPPVDSANAARIFAGADSVLALRIGPFCREANVALRVSLRDFPPLESLRAVRVPVLLVGGDRPGPWRDARPEIAAVLQDARVLDLPGAGHDPWLDRPEDFRRAVRSFVRTLPR